MLEIEKVFGEVIRHRRERMGVSQEEFARMAGVHRTYMSSIERGKVQVSIAVAQKLAQALQTPLSRVFRDVERKASSQ